MLHGQIFVRQLVSSRVYNSCRLCKPTIRKDMVLYIVRYVKIRYCMQYIILLLVYLALRNPPSPHIAPVPYFDLNTSKIIIFLIFQFKIPSIVNVADEDVFPPSFIAMHVQTPESLRIGSLMISEYIQGGSQANLILVDSASGYQSLNHLISGSGSDETRALRRTGLFKGATVFSNC